MTTINKPAPEHPHRRPRPVAPAKSSEDGAACNTNAGASWNKRICIGSMDIGFADRAWPFDREDAPPLAWWRTLPPDSLGDAEAVSQLAALKRITVLDRDADFAAALNGDPAAAIGVAFSLMPIKEMTTKTDIAMTALMRCALKRNASAALVMAQLLGLTDVGHPFATELAMAWFNYGQRYAADPHKFGEAKAVLLAAFRQRPVMAMAHEDSDLF